MFSIFEDPSLILLASDLVRLETLPKATYNKRHDEVRFYNGLSSLVHHWIPIENSHLKRAIDLGCFHDIVNMDALHIAAAESARVDRFITSESTNKPLFRAKQVNPTNLLDLSQSE